MLGLLKIGQVSSFSRFRPRIKDLSGCTGVPTDFSLELFFETDDPKGCEDAVHQALAKYRFGNLRKEFFRVDRSTAAKAMILAAHKIQSPRTILSKDIRKKAEGYWKSYSPHFSEDVIEPILSGHRKLVEIRDRDSVRSRRDIKKIAARHKWFAEYQEYEGFSYYDFLSPSHVVYVGGWISILLSFGKLQMILKESMRIEEQILDNIRRHPPGAGRKADIAARKSMT